MLTEPGATVQRTSWLLRWFPGGPQPGLPPGGAGELLVKRSSFLLPVAVRLGSPGSKKIMQLFDVPPLGSLKVMRVVLSWPPLVVDLLTKAAVEGVMAPVPTL